MIDIWTILGMTLGASLTGLLLLAVKALFHDKLNARWHYFIWSVLLVRLLIPIGQKVFQTPLALFQTIPLPQVLRFLEKYTADVAGAAQWIAYIGIVYVAGICALCLYYGAAYLYLRVKISKGKKASESVLGNIRKIAEKYQVSACKKVRICSFAESPFVIGLLRPTLVLPEQGEWNEQELEEMVLHELLHMKHLDVAVNFIIHLVRILNWFNPFLWYVLDRIQNDSEALCDQRVLEHLEAGRKKEYGSLLLRMADRKAPPNIGTTSMANGAVNIRLRMKRIVDFGHVPKENALVSLCITLILIMSCVGAAVPVSTFKADWTNEDCDRVRLRAQFFDVNTPQKALNIYMKALELQKEEYLALVLPDDLWESEKVFLEEPMYESEYAMEVLGFKEKESGQYEAEIGLYKTIHLDGAKDWNIKLDIYEDYGWKVRPTEITEWMVHDRSSLHGITPTLTAEAENEDYQVKIRFINEAAFTNVGISGWNRFGFGAPSEAFLEDFDHVTAWIKPQVTYIGKEDLTGHSLGFWCGPEELLEQADEQMRKQGTYYSSAGGSSDGSSWCNERISEDWDGMIEANHGNDDEPWKETDNYTYVLRVYLDGELDAEFVLRTGGQS